MSFKTYECPYCEATIEETEVSEVINPQTGSVYDTCCPFCKTQLSDDDIINHE